MKKSGRITPYNLSILQEKTGYVTYSVPYTEIWINFSIRMLMKTSTDFCLLDEEGYLNIRSHAGP
jgi:hypothetical protein